MIHDSHLEPNIPSHGPGKIQPTAIVIFGATGDLTHRKIIPAIYYLFKNGRLPDGCVIVGFARRPQTDAEFRSGLRTALGNCMHTPPVDEEVWAQLASRIYYHQGDLPNVNDYKALKTRLQQLPEAAKFDGNFLYYLATAPSFFGIVAENLSKAGLGPQEGDRGVRRLIVEKPFGEDITSARNLNTTLQRAFPENNIFRIDHYLGKETVQNLLYFRFGNSIYEPLWNRRYIDHVQITVAETVGVEGRGGYYDTAGAVRDMIQNHMIQLFTLIAMEPPASLDAESIRDEKVKVLHSVPTPTPQQVLQRTVRGQYGGGVIDGKTILPYRQESRVSPESLTETYVALRLEIDNWRWSGVPFYLRTGKSMARQFSEINIIFTRPPSVLFMAGRQNMRLHRNRLRLRLQPNEGIHLYCNAKVPSQTQLEQVEMSFQYTKNTTHYFPEAYERLLCDALVGESTLFTRWDEVEQAWRIVDAVRAGWATEETSYLPLYLSGSMGPVEADELLRREGRRWAPLTDGKT